jgi:hypothetical protein
MHVSPMKDLSPKKSNNKENIPPFSTKKEQIPQETEEDGFVRPLPRGALAKLRSQSDEEIIVRREEKVVTEEVITTEYFAGARIVTETHKMSSITRTSLRHHNPDDLQTRTRATEQSNGSIQSTTDHTQIQPVNKSWDFEIFEDDPENLEATDDNTGMDNIMLEEEEDKENADPGVHVLDSGDELDWHGERKSQSHKRKAQEDWT